MVNILNLNIKPFREASSRTNCFEKCLVSAFKSWGRDYELGFAKSFNFSYENTIEESELGDKLKIIRFIDNEYLLSYHGILLEKVKNVRQENIIHDIINHLRRGVPVCVKVDDFWLNWSPNYQKKHGNHYCLITGISSKDEFVCIDPIFTGNVSELSQHDFSSAFLDVYYTIEQKKEENPDQYMLALNEIIQFILANNHIDQMSEMKDDLLSELCKVSNNIPLYQYIDGIIFGRKAFLNALVLISRRGFIIDKLINGIQRICYEWEILFGVIVKGIAKRSTTTLSFIQNLSNRLTLIIELEKHYMEELNLYISNANKDINLAINATLPHINEITWNGSEIIELNEYFNNKGIGIGGSLLASGIYIEPDEILKRPELESQKYGIYLPSPSMFGLHDNLGCRGQYIDVPSRYYKALFIIGCSVWGSVRESIILEYEDATEIIDFYLSEWSETAPLFDEEIIWSGKNNLGQAFNLYCKVVYLNFDKSLRGIKLPDLSSLRIFCATLAY